MDKSKLKRWGIAVAVFGALVSTCCAAVAFHYKDAWFPLYLEWRDYALEWLQHVPAWLFFLLLATLPVLPVPMSFFYLSTGIFPRPVALLGICLAIPANLAISYWLVRSLLHPLAVRMLERANLKIPHAKTKKGEVLFSVLVRICGMPYTFQNYILALSHIPFMTYMLVGIPLQIAPAILMMFVSSSLLKGEGQKALMALGLLVALGILTKLARDILTRRKAALPPGEIVEDAPAQS